MLRALGRARRRAGLPRARCKGKVKLIEGRPLDRAAVEQSRAAIDSLYQKTGYYAAQVKAAGAAPGRRPGPGRLRHQRGQPRRDQPGRRRRQRAASPTRPSSRHMTTKPEGFWWFQKGEYRRGQGRRRTCARRLPALVRRPRLHRLPGHRATRWSRTACRARRSSSSRWTRATSTTWARSRSAGNRRFSTEEVCWRSSRSASRWSPGRRRHGRRAVQPGASGRPRPRSSRTSTPTTATSTPRSSPRRSGAPAPDGKPVVDLRWTIREGSPATINKIDHRGERRHPRAGDPRGDRDAAGRPLQPGRADPLVPERLQPELLPAADAAARRAAHRERGRRRHRLPGRRRSAPATSTSARRWGRAPASAGSSAWRSRTSSARASAASCSGSSARTSTTSR